MKRIKLIFTILFLAMASLNAQVGIGTTTPSASSMLDISSKISGVLIPRLTQVEKNGIVSPATSLIVYQRDNTTGFYYYDGSNWVLLKDTKTSIEKIDDLSDGKSDNDGTQDGSSVFFGIDAGLNDDSSDNRNVGVGYQSLYSNTLGNNNITSGFESL